MHNYPILTTEEAAKLIGWAPRTLINKRSAGDLDQPPYLRVGRRSVRYRRQAVLDWLAAHEVKVGA